MTTLAASRRYRDDFEAFAAEVARIHLYSKQRDLVRAVLEHERVACRAGNAVGKSATAAFLILHHLAGGPGSVVVSTSATDAQLRRVLWREVRRQFKRTGSYFQGATLTESEIFMEPGWFATAFSTDQPEALQGVHSERVLVVADEASGISEAMFEAVEGLLAGGDARLLLIGNPLRTSGLFFDSFNSRRDEWHTLTISAHDSPNLTGEKVPRELRRRLVSKRFVDRLEKRGVDSPEYRIRVLGEFPLRQDDAVVALGDLEQAQANEFEPGFPVVVGVDPARFGSDSTAIAVREGNRVRVVSARRGFDLMQTTGQVVDVARRLVESTGRRPVVVVDEIGVGSGVVDRLRELGEFDVRAFNSSARATRRHDYPNKRSEIWFLASEVLRLLDLDPADQDLAADLLAPSYSFASDGGRVVERKSDTRRRLRRSPDRADALLLCLVIDPPIAPGRARKVRGVSWAKGSIEEFGRFAGHPRRSALAAGAVKIGGEPTQTRFAAETPRIPLPGEVSLDERLVQLGVPTSDALADRYAAGLLGAVTEHVGGQHPFLVAGDETPRGAAVTKAPSVVERMQGGFVWDGSEDR
jgi:hypothetical protein